MPANFNRRMQQKSAQPLRPDAVSTQFTSLQMQVYACFLAALLPGGNGVYTSLVRNGGAIRIRIYAGDESYEDTIFPSDDLVYLLDTYADQFKVSAEFKGLLGALHARAAQRQSEAREGAPEGEGTGGKGPRALRGS